MHRNMRNLFFDPLHCMNTLGQISGLQNSLTQHGIILTVDEKRHIDQVMFDGLTYLNTSPR